jgi:hypothetical protein
MLFPGCYGILYMMSYHNGTQYFYEPALMNILAVVALAWVTKIAVQKRSLL